MVSIGKNPGALSDYDEFTVPDVANTLDTLDTKNSTPTFFGNILMFFRGLVNKILRNPEQKGTDSPKINGEDVGKIQVCELNTTESPKINGVDIGKILNGVLKIEEKRNLLFSDEHEKGGLNKYLNINNEKKLGEVLSTLNGKTVNVLSKKGEYYNFGEVNKLVREDGGRLPAFGLTIKFEVIDEPSSVRALGGVLRVAFPDGEGVPEALQCFYKILNERLWYTPVGHNCYGIWDIRVNKPCPVKPDDVFSYSGWVLSIRNKI